MKPCAMPYQGIEIEGAQKMVCRCCNNSFSGKAILHLENMPGMAQNFPDDNSIKNDKGIDLDLYQCPYCGLIQILDQPVEYYKEVIRASAVSKEMREFRIQYFKDFVDEYGLNKKKIVEIGSGCGEFLELMNITGAEGYGIEYSEQFVDTCRKKGLRVSKAYMEKGTKLPEAPFDGFFIMNFLEHAPDPNSFLQGIWENLRDDAVGLIEVPNVDMIVENHMFSEFIRDHLMYFTSDTLRLLLEKNGFEVLKCYPVWHRYCLAAIVRKRKIMDTTFFYDSLERMSNEINCYIDSFINQGQKVAVWGAGHQALAVIALSKIQNKIEYVVDSADFKQGKYTPGTHVKIVSPKTLEKNGEIAAIIVMAASYSDEVASIIEERFAWMKIAILRETGLEYRR